VGDRPGDLGFIFYRSWGMQHPPTNTPVSSGAPSTSTKGPSDPGHKSALGAAVTAPRKTFAVGARLDSACLPAGNHDLVVPDTAITGRAPTIR